MQHKTKDNSLKWTVAFDQDEDGSWGAVVLDLDGCFSGGDTLVEARANVREAIAAHLEALEFEGSAMPKPIGLEVILKQAAHDQDLNRTLIGAVVLESDAEEVKGRATRVQITMNEGLLQKVDQAAAQIGQTRSGFLAEGARRMMEDTRV